MTGYCVHRVTSGYCLDCLRAERDEARADWKVATEYNAKVDGHAMQAFRERDAALARVAFLERALTYIAGMCDGKAGFGVIADEARAALAPQSEPAPPDTCPRCGWMGLVGGQPGEIVASPPPHATSPVVNPEGVYWTSGEPASPPPHDGSTKETP